MLLRYGALTAAIAGLTYLALSYVLFPVWAVAGGAWIGTFVGFIGVVLSGRDPEPRHAWPKTRQPPMQGILAGKIAQT